MPNEFIIKNGFRSQGNSEVTGSLSISGSISTISPINLTGDLNIDGNIFMTGSRTIQTTTGSATTKGPTLTLRGGTGGSSSGAGGDIVLKGGNGVNPANVGGDVYIQGGDKTGSQRAGDIYIGTSGNTYQVYLQGSPIFTWDGPNATNAVIFRRGGSNRFSIYDDVNLSGNYFFNGGANTINALWSNWNSVIVRGKGTTSATTAFQVQNSSGTTSFLTRDDGVSVAYGSQLWVGKADVGEIAFSNEAATFDKRFSIRFQTSVMFIQGTLGGDKGNISVARDTSQVGFGRGIPVDSAQVQIDSTIRGFLLPRTSATSNITSSVAQGLMTYVTSSATEGLYYYNSGSYQAWTRLLNDSGSQFINGSLGIGTPTPLASLHISGSSGSALFEIDSPAVNNILFVTGSGNIGIGTGTPAYALDIRSGDLFITSSRVAYFNNIRPADNSGLITFNNFGGTRAGSMFMDGLIWRFKSHGGSDTLNIFSNGNLGINQTTDAGFRLDVNGTARVVNALTLSGVVLSLSSQGGGTISCANSAGNNTGAFITLSGPAFLNPTAGNSGMFSITGQYAPSSGTANFNHLNLTPTINNTGTYSGIVRGLYYNPTLTSLTGTTHRAIETTSGDITFGGNTRISVTGSFSITSSAGTGSAIYAYKSGSTVLDIQGSQGQLFSVVDALSGSLMSVNDVSGLPILEVFSDDRVVMGTYGAPALIVTGSVINVTGSLVVQGQVMDPAFIWFMS